MAHLIDKDALVAEIRKCLLPVIRDKHYDEWEEGQNSERIAILDIIDTLEVKEMDLEKEIPTWIKENPRERPFDDGWFIGMDDYLHRNGYKIKICDLWNLPKEPFNSKEFETI